jgi:hypothetical protein
VYPTYHENIKFLATVSTEFSSKKGKKTVVFAPSIDKNAISLPHFSLDENNLLSPVVAKTSLFLAIS